MPLINNSITLVPSLSPGKGSSSAGSMQKEQEFTAFIKELYGERGNVAGDENQLRQLKEKLISEIRLQRLLKDDELRQFKQALSHFLRGNLSIVDGCKPILERLAYLIIRDTANSTELKKQCLIDLISPLSLCSEGAQGELRSKYILLNAASVEEQLASFAKGVVELAFIITRDHNIHYRNAHLYAAYNNGLTIIKSAQRDFYGESSEGYALQNIKQIIDKQYTIDKFLESVFSSLSSELTALKMQFNTNPEYKDKILKCLAFLNINEAELNQVFSSPFKIPYMELSALLKNIGNNSVEACELMTEIPHEFKSKSSTLYVLNKKGVISFVIPPNTYEIVSQENDPKLFAALLQIANGEKPLTDLESIFNSQPGPDEKTDVTSPYLKINQHFIWYKTLQIMKEQELLAALPTTEKLSDKLKSNQQNLTKGGATEIKFNDKLKCSVYAFGNKHEIFFEQEGRYISCHDAMNDPANKKAVESIVKCMEISDFVKFVGFMDYEFNGVAQWISDNNLELISAYFASCDVKELIAFFSSKSVLRSTDEENTKINQLFKTIIEKTTQLDILKQHILPHRNEKAIEDHNYIVMQQIMCNKAVPSKEFISWLKTHNDVLQSWLAKVSAIELGQTITSLSKKHSLMIDFLSLDACKNILASGSGDSYAPLKERVDLLKSPLEMIRFFVDEGTEAKKQYNDSLVIRMAMKDKSASELVDFFKDLTKYSSEFCERWFNQPGNAKLVMDKLQGKGKLLAKFFAIKPIKKLVAGNNNIFLTAEFKKSLPIMAINKVEDFFDNHDGSNAHNIMIMGYVLANKKRFSTSFLFKRFLEKNKTILSQWAVGNSNEALADHILPIIGSSTYKSAITLLSLDACKKLIATVVDDGYVINSVSIKTKRLKNIFLEKIIARSDLTDGILGLLISDEPKYQKYNDIVISKVIRHLSRDYLNRDPVYHLELLAFFKAKGNSGGYYRWLNKANDKELTQFIRKIPLYESFAFFDFLIANNAKADIIEKFSKSFWSVHRPNSYIALGHFFKPINDLKYTDYNIKLADSMLTYYRQRVSSADTDVTYESFIDDKSDILVQWLKQHYIKDTQKFDKQCLKIISSPELVRKMLSSTAFKAEMFRTRDGSDVVTTMLRQSARLLTVDDYLKLLYSGQQLKASYKARAHNLRVVKLMIEHFSKFTASQQISAVDKLLDKNSSELTTIMKEDAQLSEKLLNYLRSIKSNRVNIQRVKAVTTLGASTLFKDKKTSDLAMLIEKVSKLKDQQNVIQIIQPSAEAIAFNQSLYDNFIQNVVTASSVVSKTPADAMRRNQESEQLLYKAILAEFLLANIGMVDITNFNDNDVVDRVEEFLKNSYPDVSSDSEDITGSLKLFAKVLNLMLYNDKYRDLKQSLIQNKLPIIDILKKAMNLIAKKDVSKEPGVPEIDLIIEMVQKEANVITSALPELKAEAEAKRMSEVTKAEAEAKKKAAANMKIPAQAPKTTEGGGLVSTASNVASSVGGVVFGTGKILGGFVSSRMTNFMAITKDTTAKTAVSDNTRQIAGNLTGRPSAATIVDTGNKAPFTTKFDQAIKQKPKDTKVTTPEVSDTKKGFNNDGSKI